jgi:hypothetical protein
MQRKEHEELLKEQEHVMMDAEVAAAAEKVPPLTAKIGFIKKTCKS